MSAHLLSLITVHCALCLGQGADLSATAKDGAAVLKIDDVRITARYNGLSFVATKFVELGESKEKLLVFYVVIENMSDAQKVNYKGWCHWLEGRAIVRDNLGNTYRRINFGASKIVGQIEDEAIYPGKMIVDKLVFEVPVDKAEELILELPAKNIGKTGLMKFSFPKAAWISVSEQKARQEAAERAKARVEEEAVAKRKAAEEERLRPQREAEAKRKATEEAERQKKKAAEDAERQAAGRLKQAKAFLADGQRKDAIEYLEQVLKRWPNTKAATEAKELLEKLKK